MKTAEKSSMNKLSAFFISLLFIFSGCTEKKETPEVRYPVKISPSHVQDVPIIVRATGELSGSLVVNIRPQVSGILTNVLFEDGQKVEEGQLLMTIDSRPFEATLKEAEAKLAEDQAHLTYALNFAETYGKLVGKEYVARLDFEESIQNVAVYKAAVEADLAAIEKAKIQLGYTEIHAPIPGYVGVRKHDPGNYVDAAEDVALTSIRNVTPITLMFSVPSDYVNKIRTEQAKKPLYVESFLPMHPNAPLSGTVFFIDNQINEQTGMIHLKARIPNQDEKGWPGQFVRVHLYLDKIQDALIVPTKALVLGQDGYSVFVVKEDQTAEQRPIKKGISYETFTVIEDGLFPEERVVTDGQLNLFTGAPLFVVEDVQERLPQ